jgi:protein TonB
MNFQALLFCQDEKTARVTTQLLNELEFSVETSTEPFAAVKKLMAQHFDAVVVDCDNEQNASLLFKGARNSTLNQSSLAVAVVEGQAGVANAFRIGANLVLTKPINVEQAKGTLRVARGLLKKGGESTKAATPSPTASPAAVPLVPKIPAATTVDRPATPAPPVSKPAPALAPAKPMAAAPIAKASADPGNVLELDTSSAEPAEEILLDVLHEPSSSVKTTSKGEAKADNLTAPGAPKPTKEAQRPLTVPVLSSGGAASAPAPAKAPASAPAKIEFEKIGDPATDVKPMAASAPTTLPSRAPHPQAPGLFSQRQSVPTFAGLDAAETDSAGGVRKFVILAIVVIALAASAYFGYTKLSKRAPAPVQNQPEPASMAEPPAAPAAAPVTSAPFAPAVTPKPNAAVAPHTPSVEPSSSAPHKSQVADAEPEVVVTTIEPEPRVVKANPSKPSEAAKSKDVEEDAPSLVGAAPDDQSAISKIVSSAPVNVPTAAPAPEMLKVSQGVTQGLLLKRVQPVYPHQALQMRIAGAVQLLAEINKSGLISGVKVLSGDPILARAAVEAVRQWKYKPYLLDGEAVDIQTQITVNFKLP